MKNSSAISCASRNIAATAAIKATSLVNNPGKRNDPLALFAVLPLEVLSDCMPFQAAT